MVTSNVVEAGKQGEKSRISDYIVSLRNTRKLE